MAIKCVFFDFDGVLRNWDYDMSGIEDKFGIPLDAFSAVAFTKESVDAAIRGEVTDEEWRSKVANKLSVQFLYKDTTGATKFWDGTIGDLVPEVLSLINECKSVVKVALFTNATSRLNSDLKALGIANLFDHVVNASEVGSIKPESEIYEYALNLAGIDAHQAFFTDDKGENVEIAEQLGWSGHLFTGAAGLRVALVATGVL